MSMSKIVEYIMVADIFVRSRSILPVVAVPEPVEEVETTGCETVDWAFASAAA